MIKEFCRGMTQVLYSSYISDTGFLRRFYVECYKGVLGVIQGFVVVYRGYTGVLQASYMVVRGVLQGCDRGVANQSVANNFSDGGI